MDGILTPNEFVDHRKKDKKIWSWFIKLTWKRRYDRVTGIISSGLLKRKGFGVR